MAKAIHTFEENDAIIKLSENQLQVIVRIASGDRSFKSVGVGSTVSQIAGKLRSHPDYKPMKFTAMVCRFAYRHGLVKL